MTCIKVCPREWCKGVGDLESDIIRKRSASCRHMNSCASTGVHLSKARSVADLRAGQQEVATKCIEEHLA